MEIIKFILEVIGILVLIYFAFFGIAMGIVMLIEWGNTKQVENYDDNKNNK